MPWITKHIAIREGYFGDESFFLFLWTQLSFEDSSQYYMIFSLWFNHFLLISFIFPIFSLIIFLVLIQKRLPFYNSQIITAKGLKKPVNCERKFMFHLPSTIISSNKPLLSLACKNTNKPHPTVRWGGSGCSYHLTLLRPLNFRFWNNARQHLSCW